MKKPNILIVAAFFAAAPLTPLLAQSSLADGLVGYYPFNGNANDESGNGIDGTPGTAVLATDRFGNPNSAYDFNGVDSFISFTQPPTTAVENVSMFCWIRATELPQWGIALSLGIGDGNLPCNGYVLGLGDPWGSDRRAFKIVAANSCVNWVDGGYSVQSTDEWHQIGFVRQSGTDYIYVDGQLRATHVIATPSPPTAFAIGTMLGSDQSETMFHGLIDDVRVYDRSLTDEEVGQLYDSEKPVITDGLVAHYPLDGNANDISGNGNDAIDQDTSNDVNRFGLAERSFAFNGSTSELSTPSALLNLGQPEYTIKMWFKFNNTDLQYQSLVFTPNRSPGIGIAYNDPTVPNKINWAVGPGGTAPGWTVSYLSGSKADYVSGQWYQLVFTKSGADYKMFIDGVIESEANVPNNFDFETGLDFGFLTSSTSYLNGNLDDIHVYHRALSASEIAELYEIETSPGIDISRAVKLIQYGLEVGVDYKLQQSTDLTNPINWVDYGDPFSATDTIETLYVDVADWNSFWRIVRHSLREKE